MTLPIYMVLLPVPPEAPCVLLVQQLKPPDEDTEGLQVLQGMEVMRIIGTPFPISCDCVGKLEMQTPP